MLQAFWRFLEHRVRTDAVLAEWQQLCPAFDDIKPLLRPTDETAHSYPNPGPSGLPLKVARCPDGQIFAVCREGGDLQIRLQSADLALFAVDLGQLPDVMAEALYLVPSRHPLDAFERALPIGVFRSAAGALPVILIRTPYADDAEREIERLVLQSPQPAILLTPTRAHWSGLMLEFCDKHKFAVAALSDCVSVNQRRWFATDNWQTSIEPLIRRIAPKKPIALSGPKRARRATNIEALKKAIGVYNDALVGQLKAMVKAKLPPVLPKLITKAQLGKMAGLKPYEVSRCFKDDPQLFDLWRQLGDIDFLLNRRRAR